MFSGADLSYGWGRQALWAGLKFTLKPGEALVLQGPNGVGKSTLLRVLSGLLDPWQGNLFWNGEIIQDQKAHAQHLCYVGHHNGLKDVLSPIENLTFFSQVNSASGSVNEALDSWKISHLKDKPCRSLSVGQKRRVALARCLLQFRPLWVLDEPTASLDAEGIALLTQMITQHQAAGGMVVMSSHTPLSLSHMRTWILPDEVPL